MNAISKEESGTCNTLAAVVEPRLSLTDVHPSLVSLQNKKYKKLLDMWHLRPSQLALGIFHKTMILGSVWAFSGAT